MEHLESRQLLDGATDLAQVPLWDGERQDAPGHLTNYLGGNVVAQSHAALSYATDIVHAGQGGYRIATSASAGTFAFVQVSLGASDESGLYVDTRDLTPYESASFWTRNRTGAPFTMEFGIKDYLDSNGQQARWRKVIPLTDQWVQVQVPLNLTTTGWTVSGTPDLSRARSFSFVISADQGQAVSGDIYLDDVSLTEPGGPVDIEHASVPLLAERLAKREFLALWGARDRTNALVPSISAYEDVLALNVTAGLVKSLPGAMSRAWVSQAEADTYVSTLVSKLGQIMDQSHYLPARYVDRISLQATNKAEESSVDAAYMYLALYQYQALAGITETLRADISHLLNRFNFQAFATAQGWTWAYDPTTASFTTGTYDGYSGETWVISLAAHLAGQVDIKTLYHSGAKRVSQATLGGTDSYLVHTSSEYRAPFMQWIFSLFVDVSQRGADNYPDAALAANPWTNAVRYQCDADARLSNAGRGSWLQPDAGTDWQGLSADYHAYSVFNDFGRPGLFMPWSLSFDFLANPDNAGTALRELLAAGLNGPFGLADSAYWDNGAAAPRDVAARYDLWNTTLSLWALEQYLFQDNQLLTAIPAVDSALDKVFAYQTYGLDVSPYIADGENPDRGTPGQVTEQELRERLATVAPYTQWIRTFDCGGDLEPASHIIHDELGKKAAIGAWINRNLTTNQANIDRLVAQAIQGDVDLAIVGSEVLRRGDVSAETLIGYINQVKTRLAAANVPIPVTTADIYGQLLGHPDVLNAVDVVFANYYPFWEGSSVQSAMASLQQRHQQLQNAAGSKEVIVSETGWPSAGETHGEAVPSPENAAYYFQAFVSWARAHDVKYFYFAALDEPWKGNEGELGKHWGVWDTTQTLKPGMQEVFDGHVLPDTSSGTSGPPIIDFAALPATIDTNLDTFVVAGVTQDPGDAVKLNGTPIAANAQDASGVFSFAVPLAAGANKLVVRIESSSGHVQIITKTVNYEPQLSTRTRRLVYVDAVVGESESLPYLDGTVVIDPDRNAVLGLIPGKHVRGISPSADELYMDDRTVISTASHQPLRTLPFTNPIPLNGFLVSPQGDRLYSNNEVLNVSTNTLEASLPVGLTTGLSWASASTPGGPAVSADGSTIYAQNTVQRIDVADRTAEATGAAGKPYVSDIAVSPDGSRLLVSGYGRLDIYDANSSPPMQLLATLGTADFGGEIAFLVDGKRAVVGASGNPQNLGGGVFVVDVNALTIARVTSISLADNLESSGLNNEVFVSSGDGGSAAIQRLGIDVFSVGQGQDLTLSRTFFLGINAFARSYGRPRNDQIRRIVYKPAPNVGPTVTLTPDSLTMFQDQTAQLAAGAVAITDPDARDGRLQATVTVTHGSLMLGATSDLSFTVGDGVDDTAVTFAGNLTALNAAFAGATFTPATGFAGTATIAINVNDQGNIGSGGLQSDEKTWTVTVQPGRSAFADSGPATFGGAATVGRTAAYQSAFGDGYVRVDTARAYQLTGTARSGDGAGNQYNPANAQYFGFAAYDADKKLIAPLDVLKVPAAADTRLAVDLIPGATQIALENATGWYNGATGHARSLAWYGYQDSSGTTYADYTYTRNVLLEAWAAGGVSGNTITLKTAWSGPKLLKGTAVRNAMSGATYQYAALAGAAVPAAWTTYSVTLSGVEQNGVADAKKFPPGTVYVRPLLLMNCQSGAANQITWRDVNWLFRSGDTVDVHTAGLPASGTSWEYAWTQTAGPPVTLQNRSAPTASFAIPAAFPPVTLQVAASNGRITLTSSLAVNYTLDPATAVALDTTTFGGADAVSRTTSYQSVFGDDYVRVDTARPYQLTGTARSGDGAGNLYNAANAQYFGFAAYDADKKLIEPLDVLKVPAAADTRLAADLVPGATQIVVENAAGWYNGTTAHARSLAWYGYQDSTGTTYADYTYTRNVLLDAWPAGGISGKVIALKKPWAGPTLRKGTAVRNAMSGPTYQYAAVCGAAVSQAWTTYSATVSDVQQNGVADATKFPPGTAYVRPLLLVNYQSGATNQITWRDVRWSVPSGQSFRAGDVVDVHVAEVPSSGGPVSYNWTQTAGPPVTLQNAATRTARFVIPAVFPPVTLQIAVSNGSATLTSPVTVSYELDLTTSVALDTTTFGGADAVSRTTSYQSVFGDDYVRVDTARPYQLTGTARSGDGAGNLYNAANAQYFGFAAYDADKKLIEPLDVLKVPAAADTRLAADLVPGATQIVVENAAGWYNGTTAHARSLAWYGYQDSTGTAYADYSYTRNVLLDAWPAGGISGKVIALKKPWAGPTLRKGTAVRNAMSGATYQYAAVCGAAVPSAWTTYSATVSDVQQNGVADATKFPPGTAYIRPLMLVNYQSGATNQITWRDVRWSVASGQSFRAGDVVDLRVAEVPSSGGPLTYTWAQTAGPAVTLQKATTRTASVVVPSVTGSPLSFRVSVSNGSALLQKVVSVNYALPLLAAGDAVPRATVAPTLEARTLTPVVQHALALWAKAGLDAQRLAALQQVHVVVADLHGMLLGTTSGNTITLDADAAGYGWTVCGWSSGDLDGGTLGSRTGAVSGTTLAVPVASGMLAFSSSAAPPVDLLTAVLHEQGHVLGLADRPSLSGASDLMLDQLPAGLRRLPTVADVDAVFAQALW